jgi:hypothetical protein
MDENFLAELAAEGEKRFGFEIPLSMTFGDTLNSFKGTLDDVIAASDNWKDKDGLKSVIGIEASGWRQIFQKAVDVASNDELSFVTTLGEGDNAQKLIQLAGSGNQMMKHLFIDGEVASDVLKMYLVFRIAPGPRITTDIDFG